MSATVSIEWAECDRLNAEAAARYREHLAQRAGVAAPQPDRTNPQPVILDEPTAVEIYQAARRHTEQVAQWQADAANNFARVEAKVNSFGTLKDEIRDLRQTDIKLGKRPSTPPAKRSAMQALTDAEQELVLARDEKHDFDVQLANAKAEENRCYIVARNSVGVALGNAVIRPLITQYVQAFDTIEAIKLKLATVPHGIGDVTLANAMNQALRREQNPPNDMQTAAARQDWRQQHQARLDRLLQE